VSDNLHNIVADMRTELAGGTGALYRIMAGPHVLTLDVVPDGVTWLVRAHLDDRSVLHGDVVAVDPDEFRRNLYVFLRVLLRGAWPQEERTIH
jgi:hypothetical protein